MAGDGETGGSLTIGPTTLGLVRIHLMAEGIDLPLDFDPDEAEEIAEELRAAAEIARQGSGSRGPRGKSGR